MNSPAVIELEGQPHVHIGGIAEMTGMSKDGLRRAIDKLNIPAAKDGRQWFIPASRVSALAGWMDENPRLNLAPGITDRIRQLTTVQSVNVSVSNYIRLPREESPTRKTRMAETAEKQPTQWPTVLGLRWIAFFKSPAFAIALLVAFIIFQAAAHAWALHQVRASFDLFLSFALAFLMELVVLMVTVSDRELADVFRVKDSLLGYYLVVGFCFVYSLIMNLCAFFFDGDFENPYSVVLRGGFSLMMAFSTVVFSAKVRSYQTR
jgi:hypothetical protein